MKSVIRILKPYSFWFIVSTFILVISNLTSCSKGPGFKEFLIKVDSINAGITTVYSEMYAGSYLEVDLYGVISGNGCSSFSHCNTYVKDNDLIIEAWKKVDTEATVCPTVMVYLNQHINYGLDKLPSGFNIKVKQPDGTFLVKKVNLLK